MSRISCFHREFFNRTKRKKKKVIACHIYTQSTINVEGIGVGG